MKVDIPTPNVVKQLVREEVNKLRAEMYSELNKFRGELRLIREEMKAEMERFEIQYIRENGGITGFVKRTKKI